MGAVACSLQPASYRTLTTFGRNDDDTYYDLYTASNISGSTKRRVVIGGVAYTVQGYMPYPPGVTLAIFKTVISKRSI